MLHFFSGLRRSSSAGELSASAFESLDGKTLSKDCKPIRTLDVSAAEWRGYVEKVGLGDAEERPLIHFLGDALEGVPLPLPWMLCKDKEGRFFFVDATSGVSTWVHPFLGALRELAEAFRAYAKLDEGAARRDYILSLLEAWDSKARHDLSLWIPVQHNGEDQEYFYRTDTKEVSWTRPTDAVLPELFLKQEAVKSLLGESYSKRLFRHAHSGSADSVESPDDAEGGLRGAGQAAQAGGGPAGLLTKVLEGVLGAPSPRVRTPAQRTRRRASTTSSTDDLLRKAAQEAEESDPLPPVQAQAGSRSGSRAGPRRLYEDPDMPLPQTPLGFQSGGAESSRRCPERDSSVGRLAAGEDGRRGSRKHQSGSERRSWLQAQIPGEDAWRSSRRPSVELGQSQQRLLADAAAERLPQAASSQSKSSSGKPRVKRRSSDGSKADSECSASSLASGAVSRSQSRLADGSLFGELDAALGGSSAAASGSREPSHGKHAKHRSPKAERGAAMLGEVLPLAAPSDRKSLRRHSAPHCQSLPNLGTAARPTTPVRRRSVEKELDRPVDLE